MKLTNKNKKIKQQQQTLLNAETSKLLNSMTKNLLQMRENTQLCYYC